MYSTYMSNTSPKSTKRPSSARTSSDSLRRGWTTGSCATAAVKSAVHALIYGTFLDPVTITLPKGQAVSFALSSETLTETCATASVIKDAGDDPDITHGASVVVSVTQTAHHRGIEFAAGPGVGTVTRPGLPIAVGEPSITPVPREMMCQAIREIAPDGGFRVTISIPGGEEMASKTMNPRLGVIGGLSILGTTGVVVPYSCASWIHSIHRGIDVAKAAGLDHVIGCTGATSEKRAQQHYAVTDQALLDMGDFAGGLLKYIRVHPIPRLTIAGGIGKLAKLARGEMDLHSARSQVDIAYLASLANNPDVLAAETAAQALLIDPTLGDKVAKAAASAAQKVAGEEVSVDTLVVTREGQLVGTWKASQQ